MTYAPAPLGEFELIAKYLAPIAAPGALGLLDDAAVLQPPAGHDLVLTKDALVASVHFFPDDPPDTIARKALRVNLSDLAAKGATPIGFMLGLGLPEGWTEPWLAHFTGGLRDDATTFNCPLFGGDTVKSAGALVLSITAIGMVPAGHMVRRDGGRPGDDLFVTGTIGDGALGLIERQRQRAGATCDARLVDRYLLPQPRMALAPALLAHAHAAMDISDGLVGDATKLAVASVCGLEIEARDVPLSSAAKRMIAHTPSLLQTALTGGDDYEILAAVSPGSAALFCTAAKAAGVTLTKIGRLTDAKTINVRDESGLAMEFTAKSFHHF